MDISEFRRRLRVQVANAEEHVLSTEDFLQVLLACNTSSNSKYKLEVLSLLSSVFPILTGDAMQKLLKLLMAAEALGSRESATVGGSLMVVEVLIMWAMQCPEPTSLLHRGFLSADSDPVLQWLHVLLNVISSLHIARLRPRLLLRAGVKVLTADIKKAAASCAINVVMKRVLVSAVFLRALVRGCCRPTPTQARTHPEGLLSSSDIDTEAASDAYGSDKQEEGGELRDLVALVLEMSSAACRVTAAGLAAAANPRGNVRADQALDASARNAALAATVKYFQGESIATSSAASVAPSISQTTKRPPVSATLSRRNRHGKCKRRRTRRRSDCENAQKSAPGGDTDSGDESSFSSSESESDNACGVEAETEDGGRSEMARDLGVDGTPAARPQPSQSHAGLGLYELAHAFSRCFPLTVIQMAPTANGTTAVKSSRSKDRINREGLSSASGSNGHMPTSAAPEVAAANVQVSGLSLALERFLAADMAHLASRSRAEGGVQAVLRALVAQLVCLASEMAADLPPLPCPPWCNQVRGSDGTGSIHSSDAAFSHEAFSKRGKKWILARRVISLVVHDAAGSAVLAQTLYALLLESVNKIIADLCAAVESSSTDSDSDKSNRGRGGGVQVLVCLVEALVGFVGHLGNSSAAMHVAAVRVLKELSAMLAALFRAQAQASFDRSCCAVVDFSTVRRRGSADDSECACAIRLLSAAFGYILVHQMAVLFPFSCDAHVRASAVAVLSPLIGEQSTEGSRLAFLRLQHPAVAMYIAAYVLPRIGVYCDGKLIAAVSAGSGSSADFARLDLCFCFGSVPSNDASATAAAPYAQQWPPDMCVQGLQARVYENEYKSSSAMGGELSPNDSAAKGQATPAVKRVVNPHSWGTSAQLAHARLALIKAFGPSTAYPRSSSSAARVSAAARASRLPADVVLHILPYLSARQLCRIAQASKEFRLMGLWNVLWLDLYHKRFPLSIFGQCTAGAATADSFSLARKSCSAPLFTSAEMPADAAVDAGAQTAAKSLFNTAGCCDKCHGAAGITSGIGSANAAAEQERAKSEKRFMSLTFAPIPLPESGSGRATKSKSSASAHFCASPDLRHDWRRLFRMRYEVYCSTSSKNARKKGDADFQACNVIGCTFVSKSEETKNLHAKAKHPLLDPQDVWLQRRSSGKAKRKGNAVKA